MSTYTHAIPTRVHSHKVTLAVAVTIKTLGRQLSVARGYSKKSWDAYGLAQGWACLYGDGQIKREREREIKRERNK